MKDFDVYEGQEIVEPEFIQLVRRFRELEIKQISMLFSNLDSGAGALPLESVVMLLSQMGYVMPSRDVIMENAIAAGLSRESKEFYFEDVLMIAGGFRKCEGFLQKELEQFKDTFKTHDFDKSGEIDAVELGAVLRWLGCPGDVETAQDLMEHIDIDKSGYVDFEEFLKVMRRFRESELELLERAYSVSDTNRSGGLDAQELKLLLCSLDYEVTPAHMNMLVENYTNKEASFDECAELIAKFREELRQVFQHDQGFTKKELSTLKRKLEKSGSVDNDLMIKFARVKSFLSDEYPSMMKLVPEKEIDDIMQRFHSESESLPYREFLRLLRMVTDQADYHKVVKQREIAEQAGFTPAEVMEIRKIFKMIDNESSRSLDFNYLEDLLLRILPCTGRTVAKLAERMKECDVDQNERIDFDEFIKLMRRLMDGDDEDDEDEDLITGIKQHLRRISAERGELRSSQGSSLSFVDRRRSQSSTLGFDEDE
jgi:Ca2+-binding EF-hand superfamily protein